MEINFPRFEPEKDINEKEGVVHKVKHIENIPNKLPPKQPGDRFIKTDETKIENDISTYDKNGKRINKP